MFGFVIDKKKIEDNDEYWIVIKCWGKYDDIKHHKILAMQVFFKLSLIMKKAHYGDKKIFIKISAHC